MIKGWYNLTMKSVKEIFEIIRLGDQKRGVEMLYNLHYTKMYAMAFSVVKRHDLCENVIHDVVYDLLKIETYLFPREGEDAWLHSIVKHQALKVSKQASKDAPLYKDILV